MEDKEYKNSFTVTGKVITDPILPHNKNIVELDILYKEKIKYKVHVSLKKFEMAKFVNDHITKDMYIDVAGKIQQIPATVDYQSYILIHATFIELR